MSFRRQIADALYELVPRPQGHRVSVNEEPSFARIMFWHIWHMENKAWTHEWSAGIVVWDDKTSFYTDGSTFPNHVYEHCDPAFPQNLLIDVENFFSGTILSHPEY